MSILENADFKDAFVVKFPPAGGSTIANANTDDRTIVLPVAELRKAIQAALVADPRFRSWTLGDVHVFVTELVQGVVNRQPMPGGAPISSPFLPPSTQPLPWTFNYGPWSGVTIKPA